jgi:Zn-dependent metalloprotease
VGRAKAEKIWYRAVTVYMTSDTNYAGARAATLSAASDLYGPASAERAQVAAAWSAVSVN